MGLSVPISSSSSATSGADIGPTILGTTFGNQYASTPSTADDVVSALTGSSLGLVLLGGGALVGFLLWRKYSA